MRRTTVFALILAALLVTIGLLSACGGAAEPAPEDPTSVPTDPPASEPTEPSGSAPTEPPEPTEPPKPETANGEVLLEQRCTGCHGLERTTSVSKSAEEWESTVSRMVDKGAELNAEEQAVLVEYLAENYGP